MNRNLRREFRGFAQNKENVIDKFPGVLGITKNGEQIVEVTGRPGFVWVRLRNTYSEVIQAYNTVVTPIFDLPVYVQRDPLNPMQYSIVGRDVARYGASNWGSVSAYLPPHGNSHSFSPETSGGGDVVWVYGRQFMPFLVVPSGSAGAFSVSVQGGIYYYDNMFRYAGGTGIALDNSYKPTGTSNARMTLLLLDKPTGNFVLVAGTQEFPSTVTGTVPVLPYIPPVPTGTQEPLAAIRLLDSTTTISWSNLYDVRIHLDFD